MITIRGIKYGLWRAIEADGNVLDILVQPRRNAKAARRFPGWFSIIPSAACWPTRNALNAALVTVSRTISGSSSITVLRDTPRDAPVDVGDHQSW
jgi:hypothetical protein